MNAFRKVFYLSCCVGLIFSFLLLPEGVFNMMCGQNFISCTLPKIRRLRPLYRNSSGREERHRRPNAFKKTYLARNSSATPSGLLHPAARGSGCPSNISSSAPATPAADVTEVVSQLLGVIKCLTQLPTGRVLNLLTETLSSTTEDLRPMLRELQTFRSQFACPSCIDDRPPPVTALSVGTRLPHNATWRGVALPAITVTPQGRLGNLMCEYATLFALRDIYGASAVLIGKHASNLQEVFTKITIPTDKKATGRQVSGIRWTHISPHAVARRTTYSAMQLAAAGLLGPKFFQGEGYSCEIELFAAFREKLRREFSFKSKFEKMAKRKISITVGDAQKASDVVLVGIHIRLGDYQNYLKKRYDVKNWSYDKYLRGAVGYFTRKYAKVRFIATSDDGLAAKKILRKIDKNITLIASGSAAEAMCLLSMCHHNILTFGTFSFWIGFLGRGVALYPDLRFPQRQYLLSRHTYDRAKLHDFLPIPLQ